MQDGLSFEEMLRAGRTLRREGQAERAVEHFGRLAERYPNRAVAHLELASTLDNLGREAEAIPSYRRALELHLPDEDAIKALLGLGSSLRNVGKSKEAVQILRDGKSRFPGHAAMRVFLALALHGAGRPQEALVELLELTQEQLHSPEMTEYARSIRQYTEELKERKDG